jgi:DNA-binding NarL/FixJ family response regulator
MPGINGRELAERLRETWPELRVLFTSGYTDDAMIASGMLAPGSRFLQKPFTLHALAQAAYDVLTA